MDFLVRGPIFKTDADGERPSYATDSTESYLGQIRRWRESAREEAFATVRLSPEIDAIQKYVKCLSGDWWNRRRAQYKSRFFDNRLQNARLSDLALLTDARPTIAVSSNIPAYKQQAEMAQRIIQSEWVRSNIDLDFVRVTDIAKLNGTAFWKIGAASPGRMQVVPCGPENVLPIQPGFDLQQSSAVLYRTWKPISYFRMKFPFTAAGIEREGSDDNGYVTGENRYNRPSYIPEYTWNGLAPQMRRAVSIESSASDMGGMRMFQNVELQEYYVDDPAENESKYDVLMRHPFLSLKQHNYWYWVKPGQPLYPRKRLLVFGGRKLLYDGPAPFWHGLYPFACMRLNPVPWSFWGLSKYRDLLPLNDAMNEIMAGILDMVKRALNPTALTKNNAVAPSVWREFYPDMPGAKLTLMANASIGDVRYMEPPSIPQWVMMAHQYLAAEFDRLAGAIDVTALGKKKQVPGGDTLEQMREMQNAITRLEGRYSEKFLEDAGQQAVSNVYQFWELGQRLKLLGSDGITWEDCDTNESNMLPSSAIPKEDFWRGFAMKVDQGSLLSNARDREKQLAMSLAAHGLLPVQTLYQTLGIPDPAGTFKLLEAEHQQGVMPTGRSPRTSRGQRNGKAA